MREDDIGRTCSTNISEYNFNVLVGKPKEIHNYQDKDLDGKIILKYILN
jgi:hypothetical protein